MSRACFPAVRGGAPTRALEPTTITVGDNDFVTILGPSGCGKSTLLRLVAGLDTPTAGEVLLDGKPVTAAGSGPRHGVPVVHLVSLVDGRRQCGVRLAREGRRRSRAHAHRRLNGSTRVGLTSFANHYPKQLSGGMQQRTAIARALANDPAILLLDEPFGALDNQTRALMQELAARHLGARAQDRAVRDARHRGGDLPRHARAGDERRGPGRIKADVPIALPYPRHYTVKTSPEFSALKARLTEEIRVEAVLAAEGH